MTWLIYVRRSSISVDEVAIKLLLCYIIIFYKLKPIYINQTRMSSLDHPYLAPPLTLLLSPPYELSLTAFQHSLSTASSPLPQPLDAPFTLSIL